MVVESLLVLEECLTLLPNYFYIILILCNTDLVQYTINFIRSLPCILINFLVKHEFGTLVYVHVHFAPSM